jgi:hypothetical protein
MPLCSIGFGHISQAKAAPEVKLAPAFFAESRCHGLTTCHGHCTKAKFGKKMVWDVGMESLDAARRQGPEGAMHDVHLQTAVQSHLATTPR